MICPKRSSQSCEVYSLKVTQEKLELQNYCCLTLNVGAVISLLSHKASAIILVGIGKLHCQINRKAKSKLPCACTEEGPMKNIIWYVPKFIFPTLATLTFILF